MYHTKIFSINCTAWHCIACTAYPGIAGGSTNHPGTTSGNTAYPGIAGGSKSPSGTTIVVAQPPLALLVVACTTHPDIAGGNTTHPGIAGGNTAHPGTAGGNTVHAGTDGTVLSDTNSTAVWAGTAGKTAHLSFTTCTFIKFEPTIVGL